MITWWKGIEMSILSYLLVNIIIYYQLVYYIYIYIYKKFENQQVIGQSNRSQIRVLWMKKMWLN